MYSRIPVLLLFLLWPLAGWGGDATSFNPLPIPVVSQAPSAIPVGTITVWPAGSLPALEGGVQKWAECNGQTMDPSAYQALCALLGAGCRLPDTRGEFVRGWDHGRGVDAGRGLGTWQDQAMPEMAARITQQGWISAAQTTAMQGWSSNSDTGVYDSVGGNNWYSRGVLVTPTGSGPGVRPSNVALMYIIRTLQ